MGKKKEGEIGKASYSDDGSRDNKAIIETGVWELRLQGDVATGGAGVKRRRRGRDTDRWRERHWRYWKGGG